MKATRIENEIFSFCRPWFLKLDDLKGALLKTEMEMECSELYQYIPKWTRLTPEYTGIITEWTGTIRVYIPGHSGTFPCFAVNAQKYRRRGVNYCYGPFCNLRPNRTGSYLNTNLFHSRRTEITQSPYLMLPRRKWIQH